MSKPVTPAPWVQNPYRLWSLLDMLKDIRLKDIQTPLMIVYVYSFTLRLLAQKHDSGKVRMDEYLRQYREIIKSLGEPMAELTKIANLYGLHRSLAWLDVVQTKLDATSPASDEINDLVGQLIDKFYADLDSHKFMYLDAISAKLYTLEPNDFVEFPLPQCLYEACSDDIREALLCVALGCSTACVFHCCRALEAAMSRVIWPSLKAGPLPTNTPTWGDYIAAIGKHVSVEKKRAPMANDWDMARVKFYEQVCSDYGKLKDAERADITHYGKMFTESRTRTLLSHFKDLMFDAAQNFDDSGEYKRATP